MRDDVAVLERPARPGDGGYRHTYERLEDLLAISSALGRITDVGDAVLRVLAVIGRSLALRTAVLVLEHQDGLRASVWRARNVSPEVLAAASEHACTGLTCFQDDWAPPVTPDLEAHHDYLTLPLTISADRVFGLLQLEAVAARHPSLAIGEADLAFANASAGLLAEALDRHLAWESDRRNEREQRALVQRLTATLESRGFEVVGRLAGAIAHEFNNKLMVVLGNVDVFLEELGDDHPLQPSLVEVHDAAESALRLTSDLLAFARKQRLRPRRLEMSALLPALRGALERVAGEAVWLDLSVAPDCFPVMADPDQLERVLVILVANAREAMADGGLLSIRAGNASAPGHVRLVVADTGDGLDEETRARMFEPFFTTKRFGPSSGMGLAAAQGIVAQSGGWITARSRPGRGTEVSVFLPQAAEPALVAAEAAPRAPATILVVDDQAAIVRLAANVLRNRGYAVLEATGGAHAIALANRFEGRLDLVISELVMPRVSGPEVARAIRASRPDVAIAYISGYPEDQLALRSIPGPAPTYMGKPFSPAELFRLVDRTLARAD